MSRLHMIIVALSALLGCAGQASAATCAYDLNATQSGVAHYSPTRLAGTVVRFTFSTSDQNLPNQCTSVPIEIRSADGGDFSFELAGTRLVNAMINSNQVQGPKPNRVELNGNARNTIVGGGTAAVDLFAFAPGQFVRGGIYEAHLLIQVGDQPPVPVVAQVIVDQTFRFVPENGSSTKTLSFGDVTGGSERSSAIYYQTNAAFQLRATSANGGVLVHEEGAAFGDIAYAARYNDIPLSLGNGPVIVSQDYAGLGTRVDRLNVSIAPQTGKYAGTYRDTVTLEFIPF